MNKKQMKSQVKEVMKEIYSERLDKAFEIVVITVLFLFGLSLCVLVISAGIHDLTLIDGLEKESSCKVDGVRISGDNIKCYEPIMCSYYISWYNGPECDAYVATDETEDKK